MGEVKRYDFQAKLSESQISHGEKYEEVIKRLLPGVISVEKTEVDVDKTGIDYITTLRKGAEIGIDLKVRAKGCSAHWANGEELALEIWSVCPNNRNKGIAGWTLDEAKKTDYTMHVFHKTDSNKIFLLPFQLLRKSFVNNFGIWNKRYKKAKQDSGGWQSECLFVPARVVVDAIRQAMST
jgi:hypothetical protein